MFHRTGLSKCPVDYDDQVFRKKIVDDVLKPLVSNLITSKLLCSKLHKLPCSIGHNLFENSKD